METGPALIDGSRRSQPGGRFTPQSPTAGGSAAQCDIALTVPARADGVVLVRRLVGTLAESAGLPPQRLDDVRLAGTEACTNVVRHAYAEHVGPLSVTARLGGGSLAVTVTDEGTGLRPLAGRAGDGLGLPLMAAVAQQLEIRAGDAGGTCVRMSFALGL